ncbi:glycosyltransferase family 2 protein [Sphingomonas yunnanensis]|nr:glycosyltransferase family 2 protein [Sphingomonas yunnanensis]MBY9064135.1 glycosyltransferase family 2 protein [Sphingomonas yunnanensis]
MCEQEATSDRRAPPAQLAIVVPAFNERENVASLVDALDRALSGLSWEVIFVDDDSPDGTATRVRVLAQRDARVRILQRVGRRGLASACIEGMLATASPFIAVIDCDLQHDETLLPAMLDLLRSGDTDLVVGTRYSTGGGVADWARNRAAASRLATRLAVRLTKIPMSDPMSGFFMLTRASFERSLPHLSSVGFKILMDLILSAPSPLRLAELPYTFRARRHGDSKMDSLVLWEFGQLLLEKLTGGRVPLRFFSFALVGLVGLFVHILTFVLVYVTGTASFSTAQIVATAVAITNNFALNNKLTYRDQRLRGRALLRGWLTFNLVCVTGAVANINISQWLIVHNSYWLWSAVAGALVSVVWNYGMSSVFTWRRRLST